MTTTIDDARDVRLVPLTFENAPQLARLFEERDVWRNFGYESAPSSFALRLRLRQRDVTGLLFHRVSVNRPIGFTLAFGTPGPSAALEFAIAVPDPNERRKNIAKTVGMRAVGWLFEHRLCDKLWAWGDAKNAAMVNLVKSCGWEMLGVSKGAQQMVDGVADTVQVQMTRAGWLQWCAQQPK